MQHVVNIIIIIHLVFLFLPRETKMRMVRIISRSRINTMTATTAPTTISAKRHLRIKMRHTHVHNFKTQPNGYTRLCTTRLVHMSGHTRPSTSLGCTRVNKINYMRGQRMSGYEAMQVIAVHPKSISELQGVTGDVSKCGACIMKMHAPSYARLSHGKPVFSQGSHSQYPAYSMIKTKMRRHQTHS